MAVKSTNPRLSRKLLSGLQVLIPSRSAWDDFTMSPELNILLGELAVEDSDVGDQAARLVGHLRSKSAVNFILKKADNDRLIPVLLEIQQSAGNLPALVPGNIRLRVTLEWIVQRLTPTAVCQLRICWRWQAPLWNRRRVFNLSSAEFMDIDRISSSLNELIW
jgi:hypothetical protein